jgi:hypothetical protein
MSVGESHPHGSTTCAYEGVNGVRSQRSQPQRRPSVFCVSFSIRFFPLLRRQLTCCSRFLESTVSSFRLVANCLHRLQSSLESIFWTESCCAQRRSPSLWISLIGMGEPHAHMRESMESTSDSSLSLFVTFSIRLSASSSIDVLFRPYYSVVRDLRHFASL